MLSLVIVKNKLVKLWQYFFEAIFLPKKWSVTSYMTFLGKERDQKKQENFPNYF